MNLRNTASWTLALLLAGVAPAQAADIYKTVDENGNVVYTDRPPEPGAEPLTLRELSVVETPSYPSRKAAAGDSEGPEELTVNQLRQRYRDFRLVSPEPESNLWGTGNSATLSWSTGEPLVNGMAVVYYLDGVAVMGPTQAPSFTSGQLDRGEHQASAQLLDINGNVVARTEPVTFYIMQNSRNFGGGGGT